MSHSVGAGREVGDLAHALISSARKQQPRIYESLIVAERQSAQYFTQVKMDVQEVR